MTREEGDGQAIMTLGGESRGDADDWGGDWEALGQREGTGRTPGGSARDWEDGDWETRGDRDRTRRIEGLGGSGKRRSARAEETAVGAGKEGAGADASEREGWGDDGCRR
jgi:hypothetical protein